MCAESSHIPSGFGNYTKNILQRLYNTEKYEIAELSCYRDPNVPKTEPWKIYPVAVQSNHPLYQEYISNSSNQFGQWRFEIALTDFRPHIVFDVRDFWNFTFQETSCLRQFYHWMIAPTYDSTPQKIETINSFYNADILSFHTEWAKNNLVTEYNYTGDNLAPVVSDSVDHTVFSPIDYSKSEHKKKYDISPDTIIIGSVMRNQKRKLLPDIIETFAKLSKTTNKSIALYLHTSYPDSLAWDIPELLLEYGVADRVILSYKCGICSKFFPSVFRGHKTVCRHCFNDSATIANVKHGLDLVQLKEVYNIFDIYIQYAICEGFGIPAVEAAACGIPVISVNHEAMAEVGKNIGAKLIDVSRIFREQETNAKRIYPNNDQLLEAIDSYINIPTENLIKIGENCRKLCMQNYSWDKTAKIFENIFDSVDISKKISWSCEKRQVDMSFKVEGDKNHRKLIYSIVDNIIKEPFLKHTNFVEQLIKNANDGYVQNGTQMIPFNIKAYVNILELYAKNKISLETLRSSKTDILSDKIKDFIDYSKK